LKRVYFVDTASGLRRLDEADFPLSVGGPGTDIALQELPVGTVLAHIALSSGHAYIQPADDTAELFHNHEHIDTSAWLKSGDRVQLGDGFLSWDIKGDQVFIKLSRHAEEPDLQPPGAPPPESEDEQDTVVIPVATSKVSPQKQRRLRYLLFALFSLLALAAVFVLFATPVAINISPEPDRQSVKGFPPPVSLGGKKLFVPGSYAVHASREGYRPLQQSFEVSSGGFQSFNFELLELPGRLRITVDPVVPFSVSIGGLETELNSDNIVLVERGLQQLGIETGRYLAETFELDIEGFDALQEFNISLQPAWANVQLDSTPEGAVISVDDEIIGTTPLLAEIIQGQRSIEISLAGYKTIYLRESFVAGTSRVLESFSLEPNDGTLALETRPNGATVTINGSYHGVTPTTIVLASGVSHQIKLRKPGYRATIKTTSLKPDEELQLVVDLPPEYGIIFANTNPAGVALTVDGKPAGGGTQRLRLTTRQHELGFSKAGYLPQTVLVTPQTDTSQNVGITLKTQAQAKQEARPAVLKTAGGQQMFLLEPGGSFQMGASRREAGRRANESQRLIEITRAFYLAAYEVTNAEYRLFNRKHSSGSAEGNSLNNERQPVVNVSWDDAARYCNWLSERDELSPAYTEQDGHMKPIEGKNTGYRLPSEAEWVYAAKVAGRNKAARYPWGAAYPPVAKAGNFADAQIADTLANVVAGYNDGYRATAPVGSFSAQPAGFHDLGGNVAEWTNDYYAVYPGQAEKLVKDPSGPDSGDHHVVRDSSWRDGSITELRLSYRDYSRDPRDNLGFRIARYADE
jgi:formylglycine-generating enzyme required for sulfatase activity